MFGIQTFVHNNLMSTDVIPSLVIQKRCTTSSGNSISSVNELNAEAKEMIRHKKGISPRYLQAYLDWLVFRKSPRFTIEMRKWKDETYVETKIEKILFINTEIVKLQQPIDLYCAYCAYHYGIYKNIN